MERERDRGIIYIDVCAMLCVLDWAPTYLLFSIKQTDRQTESASADWDRERDRCSYIYDLVSLFTLNFFSSLRHFLLGLHAIYPHLLTISLSLPLYIYFQFPTSWLGWGGICKIPHFLRRKTSSSEFTCIGFHFLSVNSTSVVHASYIHSLLIINGFIILCHTLLFSINFFFSLSVNCP